MANTYSQIYIQIIFAVQGRECLILKEHQEELHKYLTGIVHKRGQKLLSVYCMPDHTHLLVGLNADVSVSNLVRDLKAGSSKFINDRRWIKGQFNWQLGFGAFSYSRSQIGHVSYYIQNQEDHHKKKSFKDEYLLFLQKFEIDYNEKYLFEWL